MGKILKHYGTSQLGGRRFQSESHVDA